jgi:hypothetical protein
MNFIELASLTVALGAGGIIGAASAALLSWSQLERSLSDFRLEFDSYFSQREDSNAQRLKARFSALRRDAGVLMAALQRLRGALRIR